MSAPVEDDDRSQNMARTRRLLALALLVAGCFLGESTDAFCGDNDSIEKTLAAGQQAMRERHYSQAVHILQHALKIHPNDNRLRLELGRAYLSNRQDGRALRLFREILAVEPDNRSAKLELARTLGYARQYKESDRIYDELLKNNAADEAAAIGLASNLLHQERSVEASKVIERALTVHPNSLRLQEYKDRIESGLLGGEERERVAQPNLVEGGTDYVNDSVGNHSWRSFQRADFGIRSGLTGRVLFGQQFLHSREDSFEAVETFAEELRWKPRESLMATAGGGAVRFNNHDVHAIYDASLVFQPRQHVVLGASFSRVPITPDAEASEHRVTAQGWESFATWTPAHWQFNVRWLRQHYSDKNIASRQIAEVVRDWGGPRLTFETGYRYRRYSFDKELEHGYFSPNSYQSHLAMLGVGSRLGNRYRGTLEVRGGGESALADSPFHAAWEIYSRNEILLGNWTMGLEYSRYRLVQDTGAFRADAGRFTFTYHF